MIAEFDDNGYLPAGIHPATLDEIEARFGRESELRRVQMQSLRWLVDLAKRAGVQRIVINGSFITDIMDPNDVDCALLIGPALTTDPGILKEFQDGLPFIQMEVVLEKEFKALTGELFAKDRWGIPKGVIEVIQWNSRAQ